MPSQETPSGIEAVGPVPWGAHFCQLYETVEDMADVLVPYFKTGLERKELCHWVTSEHFGAEDAKSALRAAYPDLDRALASGQITIMDRREWYQRSGDFVAREVVDGWLSHEAKARSDGYTGYRLTGDTLWLEHHQWEAFSEYEQLVNEAFGQRRMIALCTYCLGRCRATDVLDIVGTHTFAVARRRGAWAVVESPSIKATKAELAELNATLTTRVEEATAELQGLLAHKDALLREVHHRVKNNLQIVANLLAMKSREAPEEARRRLAETADRIHAISAVHEALYENLDDHGVRLLDRLRVICGRISPTYGLDERVAITLQGEELELSLNASVPVALIATELVSNALKHAFPAPRGGRLEVKVSARPDGAFELSVSDDGVGWAPQSARRGSGLGIAMALAKQLGGNLTVEPRDGGGVVASFVAPVQ